MPDRSVLGLPGAGSDRAHHHLAGVHADARFKRQVAGVARSCRIPFAAPPACATPHRARAADGPHGRPARRRSRRCRRRCDLHDVTVIAMRRVDHQPERRIDNRARLFRIEVLHQLGRALDVGEQRRHRLALPLDCRRNVRLFRREANIRSRRCSFGCTSSGRCRVTRERRAALLTELGCGLIIRGAFRTAAGERVATFGAKPLACGAFGSALGATHAPYP